MKKVLLSLLLFFSTLLAQENGKKISIGIIGAENTHTALFGKLFNIDKEFPGLSVDYVWGETEEFAIDAAYFGKIPNIVKDPKEMLGKVDAVIIDHRYATAHLEAALPFLKAKIPIFIDKPFCYDIQKGKEFFKLAEKLEVPVNSFSKIAINIGVDDIKAQLKQIRPVKHVVIYGKSDLQSKYNGVFFYGVHMVSTLTEIFGEDVKKVRVTRYKDEAEADVVFKSGLYATLIFTKGKERGISVITDEGILVELKSRVYEEASPKYDEAIVELFTEGKELKSHSSILNDMAILKAIDKSFNSGQWEKVTE